MTKRIVCELSVKYIPLPPEKMYAYREALHTLRHGLDPVLAGSSVEVSPPPRPEVLPGAGLTTPLDISLSSLIKPAEKTSSSMLARNTPGSAG